MVFYCPNSSPEGADRGRTLGLWPSWTSEPYSYEWHCLQYQSQEFLRKRISAYIHTCTYLHTVHACIYTKGERKISPIATLFNNDLSIGRQVQSLQIRGNNVRHETESMWGTGNDIAQFKGLCKQRKNVSDYQLLSPCQTVHLPVTK